MIAAVISSPSNFYCSYYFLFWDSLKSFQLRLKAALSPFLESCIICDISAYWRHASSLNANEAVHTEGWPANVTYGLKPSQDLLHPSLRSESQSLGVGSTLLLSFHLWKNSKLVRLLQSLGTTASYTATDSVISFCKGIQFTRKRNVQ